MKSLHFKIFHKSQLCSYIGKYLRNWDQNEQNVPPPFISLHHPVHYTPPSPRLFGTQEYSGILFSIL